MLSLIEAQRAPFAGQRPNGYKDRFVPKNSTDSLLSNRFGENDISSSTPRLPHDAIGDAAAVDILNRRPVDQRPFWLINFEAIEAQRNGVPVSTASNSIVNNNVGSIDLANRFGSSVNDNNNLISQQEIVYPIENQKNVVIASTTPVGSTVPLFQSTAQSAALQQLPTFLVQQPQHNFGQGHYSRRHS